MGQFKCWKVLKTWEIWVFAKGIESEQLKDTGFSRAQKSQEEAEPFHTLPEVARGRLSADSWILYFLKKNQLQVRAV